MSANLQILIDSIEDGLIIVGQDGVVKLANRSAGSLVQASPGRRLPSEEINRKLLSLIRQYARPPLTFSLQTLPDDDTCLQVVIAESPVGPGYLINIRNLGEIECYKNVTLNLATLLKSELGTSLDNFSRQLRDLHRGLDESAVSAGLAFEQIAPALQSGETLIGQIVQMATFAETFANKPLVASDRIELLPLLEALVERSQGLLERQSLKLHLKVSASDELPVIYGSHDWLVEALHGYIEYLICHCNLNSDLDLTVHPHGAFVSLHLKNNGRIFFRAQELSASLPFEPLSRKKPADTKTRSHHSLGLGMALCRQIIALHRGGVRLIEEDGEVSTLFIELPCGAPPVEINQDIGAEQAKRYAEDLSRLMRRQRESSQPSVQESS